MVQYTSRVLVVGGSVHSVRAHVGHMEMPDIEAYLDGIEPVEGMQISFHWIDLHADVGDAVGTPVLCTWAGVGTGWRWCASQ